MSLPRLCTRLATLEAQWRSQRIAAVLQRVRHCAPTDLRACLIDELNTVDRPTAEAIMNQLTDAELEALVGPEYGAFLDTLPAAELEALTRGDAGTRQRCERAFQRWRHGHV